MISPKNNLGFGDNKVQPPSSNEGVIKLLAEIMAHAINNTIELENAKVALNAATRIIEVQQADTRMKALAIASDRSISKAGGWALLNADLKLLNGATGK